MQEFKQSLRCIGVLAVTRNPRGKDCHFVQIARQGAGHVDAGDIHDFRLLLDGELGFAGGDKAGGIAARRRVFGFALHLFGNPHAFKQLGEMNPTGAA